jgi:REP element-mobilizing transposase RayT
MARGIEGRNIFENDSDRTAFIDRFGEVVEETGVVVYAWSLLTNHFHMLLRTGRVPLSGVMRKVLTGYAGYFNRVHRRVGHLFQNRYKSILVDEELYLLELVRYIHLNPLRAGLVVGMEGLDRYFWTGHAVLLGKRKVSWQEIEDVLGRFGNRVGKAREAYRKFIEEGVSLGRRPELVGGGLLRSMKFLGAGPRLGRGRERWSYDERVLGDSGFVEEVIRDCEKKEAEKEKLRRKYKERGFEEIVGYVIRKTGLTEAEVLGGGRRRDIVEAREIIGFILVRYFGMMMSEVGRKLGVSKQSVLRGLEKGEELMVEKGWTLEEVIK